MEFNICHINSAKHSNYLLPRYTVIAETLDRDTLLDYIDGQLEEKISPFELYVGISKVHKNDNYNKKLGVKIAKEQSKLTQMEYLGMNVLDGQRHTYTFRFVKKWEYTKRTEEYAVYLTLSTVPHSEHVKLERVYICDTKHDNEYNLFNTV